MDKEIIKLANKVKYYEELYDLPIIESLENKPITNKLKNRIN